MITPKAQGTLHKRSENTVRARGYGSLFCGCVS